MTSRWTRRRALKLLGVGGAAYALQACVNTPSRALPLCVGSPVPAHTALDTHIHIFNGTDLQIAGFLSESVAPEYPKVSGVIRALAHPLQEFVWAFSPTATDELKHLDNLTRMPRGRQLADAAFAEAWVQADRDATAAQYNEFLLQQLSNSNVRHEITDALGVSASARSGIETTATLLKTAPSSALEARSIASQLDVALGMNIFEYFGRYFNYRYANFYEVVEQYSCHQSPVDTFVALMVDFDQPLSGQPNPKSPIQDQIRVMSKICQLARGRLLALAPFCPFKDIARKGGESIANVRQAWKLPGFAGVKLYPPIGFKPYGNAATSTAHGGDLDNALFTLYREAIKEDAAVLAHAGPSLCVLQGPCQTPGPPGWQEALDYLYQKTGTALRVSLGHFGDLLGTKSESSVWPEAFLRQMEKPSGSRLYADIAYEQEILDPTHDQDSVKRLQGLLAAYPVTYDRLLYGSDWLMLGLEPQWRNYLVRSHSVIDQVEAGSRRAGFAGDVFGGNARRWLGLDVPTSLASRNLRSIAAYRAGTERL